MMKSITLFAILLAVYFKIGSATNTRQNFCQVDRCLTCIGRYCTMTCQGENCKSCPLGDCCDGSTCNICRGEKCCSDAECNTCVTSCLPQCQGTPTCHYDCFQQCLPNGENREDQVNGNQVNGSPASSLISNKNYLPVNVTTIINITNTVTNENVINNPILINTTNINNYTGHNSYHRKQVQISTTRNNSDSVNGNDYQQRNCCDIIHPEKCYKIQKQTEQLCYTRKHNECSRLCISRYVHIVEDKQQHSHCITVAEEPFSYCGQYAIEKCDGCYNCTDIDENCKQSPECPEACKPSLIDEEFYNKLYRKE